MSKEFIPYEQALELKELGFDEDCLGTYYEEDKSFYINGVSYSNSYFTRAQDIDEHPLITTPLYQQAFRWFREKYSIDKTIITHYHYKTGIKSYRVGIVFINDENKIDSSFVLKEENKVSFIEHKTYEEGELACLRKLIELLKLKKDE